MTYKNGGYIRKLPSAQERVHAEMASQLRKVTSEYIADGRLAGFAVVIWDAKGASMATLSRGDTSRITTSQIPAFVAERLRRTNSTSDAAELINEALGHPDEAS